MLRRSYARMRTTPLPVEPMPSSDPPQSHDRRKALWRSPRVWLFVAVAFALGILLFVLIWAMQRNDDDFYRADSARQSVSGRQFEPLPGPDLEATDEAGKPPAPREDEGGDADGAHVVETAPPPVPEPARPTAPPVATAPASPDSPPVPVSSPPPTYPRRALRRGESGEALLRVHVGADGVPQAIDLVRSSGSRSLDRAATDAVRRWRFSPARRGGQPVAGVVQVPIAFETSRR